MPTKFDGRQSVSRDVLDQLAAAAGIEYDNLMRSINKELTPPLQMHQDTGSNRVLKIEDYTVTNPETLRKHSIPPINNVLPTGITFPISLTFPASSGGSVAISGTAFSGTAPTLTVSVSQFIKVGVNFDANGNITLTFGTEGASVAAATAPPTVDGMYAIGFAVLQNVAGTISNVTNTNVYQYVGSGGTSGSGSGNTILETLKNDFVNSPYDLMTPSVIATDTNTYVDPSSTASYSLVSKAISFASGGQVLLSTDMLDAEEFLDENKDLWDMRFVAHWKLANLDAAATYEVSRDGGSHFFPVTMSRIGDNTEVFYGDYRWAREEENTATTSSAATGGAALSYTNLAGTTEAAAQKFTFATKTRGTALAASLRRLGSPAGNYRFAIYSDAPGTPSSLLFATAWQSVSALTTSFVLTSIAVDYQHFEAGTTYYLAVETDDTYKADYAGGSKELQSDKSSAGTNQLFTLDGSTWTAVTNATGVYSVTGGQEGFAAVNSFATGASQQTLDATAHQRLSQAFTLSATNVIKRITLDMNKLGATTAGNLFVQLVRDSAGTPSTQLADIIAESGPTSIAGLSTGDITVTVAMPTTALGAGTYHIVLRTDAQYQTDATVGFSTGVRELRWRGDTGGGTPGRRFNGTVWSALATPMQFRYAATGRSLNLRLRVTSSAGSKLLEAFTAMYDKEVLGVSGGVKALQTFKFFAVANNTSSFAITAFVPEPDLVNVYHVERGKVYRYGAFSLQGNTLVFPTNFFFNNGVEEPVTLVFEQLSGGSFDNSDQNGKLLANNFLGSADSTLDRSQPGRGIFLRRPDGTLREVALNNFDELEVYSV